VQPAARRLVGVAGAAAVLLGVLCIGLVAVGHPSSAGAGALTLPNAVPISAVRYGQPPLKVLLVGDSMAGSLGVGLGELAAAYNIRLANAGAPGCSVSMDGQIFLTYSPAPPGPPCVLDRPNQLLSTWQRWVSVFRPDVVVYLARGDLINQQLHGAWTNVGHRAFNQWLSTRLRAAIGVFSSHGAKVVLMTVPMSEQHTVHSRPEDNAIRVARESAILRFVARSSGRVTTIYDLSRLLTPGLRYRASGGNVQLRCADGVHLTAEAGMVVATDLYPRLWAIAARHRAPGGGGWTSGGLPAATPAWYSKLACG